MTTDIHLLSTQELLSLPPFKWLIDQLIPEEAFVAIYGQPESGKSFIALDWAMSISEGIPWLGYQTRQAPVVYIAAEGGRGIKKRVRAWMEHHGKLDLPAMHWLLNPLYVRDPDVVESFLDTLDSTGEDGVWPGLLVVDTLSRSFGGGEENASEDMGHFVDEMTRLAGDRRMAVLVVHHTNAAGARERGHGALRGAADTMFCCKADREADGFIKVLTLENNKQKDEVRAPVLYLAPVPTVTKSLVFERTDAPPKKGTGPGRAAPAMRKVDMLRVLGASEGGLSAEAWRGHAGGIPKRTFYRRKAQLAKDGEIYQENGKWFIYPAIADIAALEEENGEETTK